MGKLNKCYIYNKPVWGAMVSPLPVKPVFYRKEQLGNGFVFKTWLVTWFFVSRFKFIVVRSVYVGLLWLFYFGILFLLNLYKKERFVGFFGCCKISEGVFYKRCFVLLLLCFMGIVGC